MYAGISEVCLPRKYGDLVSSGLCVGFSVGVVVLMYVDMWEEM
jgi:hypothetical protein